MKFNFPHTYLEKVVSDETKARKKRAGRCFHHGCRNMKRSPRANDCNTCNSRKWRMKNPIKDAYRELRKSARKRNIAFTLTLEEFKTFDKRTGYVENKGVEHDALSVDRIDSSKGYSFDNIRALTWFDNVSKKLEKMTDPTDPIAQALCLNAGGDNWHTYKKQAIEVYYFVQRLQEQDDFSEQEQETNPF